MRKLGSTVLAHVAVVKFPVAQKTDLFAADITVFLIK